MTKYPDSITAFAKRLANWRQNDQSNQTNEHTCHPALEFCLQGPPAGVNTGPELNFVAHQDIWEDQRRCGQVHGRGVCRRINIWSERDRWTKPSLRGRNGTRTWQQQRQGAGGATQRTPGTEKGRGSREKAAGEGILAGNPIRI